MLLTWGMKAQTPLAGVVTKGDIFISGCYISILVSMIVSAVVLSLKVEGKFLVFYPCLIEQTSFNRTVEVMDFLC